MDISNCGPTQGASDTVVDPSIESGDWRTRLQADSRQRIVNKIMNTLKRHLPFSGDEGLQEHKKVAVRFEEEIYIAATSQSDYSRKISLKMLSMNNRSQNPMSNAKQSSPASDTVNLSDPGDEYVRTISDTGGGSSHKRKYDGTGKDLKSGTVSKTAQKDKRPTA